jgi:hypothetical protein
MSERYWMYGRLWCWRDWNFFYGKQKETFQWPKHEDIVWIKSKDVLSIVTVLIPTRRSGRMLKLQAHVVWWCLMPLSTIFQFLPWSRFELTTSVLIGTNNIGSCKSNYHMIRNIVESGIKHHQTTSNRSVKRSTNDLFLEVLFVLLDVLIAV